MGHRQIDTLKKFTSVDICHECTISSMIHHEGNAAVNKTLILFRIAKDKKLGAWLFVCRYDMLAVCSLKAVHVATDSVFHPIVTEFKTNYVFLNFFTLFKFLASF